MLKGVLEAIVENHASIVERDKGVAFLSAACPIYQLSNLYYFCANIPRQSTGSFVQCAYSDAFAGQAITPSKIPDSKLANITIVKLAERHKIEGQAMSLFDFGVSDNGREVRTSAIYLAPRANEIAILGFARDLALDDPDVNETPPLSELKILGEYFHNHMLRRNGVDTSEALVVSARELDCLRWVAAGKSAWEASIILGISERTVRFHLNSAREKLNCTTTTQAVAKVVAQQLISV